MHQVGCGLPNSLRPLPAPQAAEFPALGARGALRLRLPRPMPLLLALPDGRRHPLDKPVVSVGSDSACDVVLDASGVKASHALLFRDARGWSVSPAGKGCE